MRARCAHVARLLLRAESARTGCKRRWCAARGRWCARVAHAQILKMQVEGAHCARAVEDIHGRVAAGSAGESIMLTRCRPFLLYTNKQTSQSSRHCSSSTNNSNPTTVSAPPHALLETSVPVAGVCECSCIQYLPQAPGHACHATSHSTSGSASACAHQRPLLPCSKRTSRCTHVRPTPPVLLGILLVLVLVVVHTCSSKGSRLSAVPTSRLASSVSYTSSIDLLQTCAFAATHPHLELNGNGNHAACAQTAAANR